MRYSIMNKEDLETLLLETKDSRFKCYQADGKSEDRRILEEFKAFVKRKNEKFGYVGFSMEIDNRFDADSQYFYTRNESGLIVVTSRVTVRRPDNIIPFEMGFKPDGTKYIVNEPCNVGDVNSFGASWNYLGESFEALFLLYVCLANFVIGKGMEKVFCLLDLDNPQIVQTYTGAGFELSEKYKEPIYFPSYGKLDENNNLVPTKWRIMEMTAEKFQEYADKTTEFKKSI